jgi:hypothetical protein
VTEFVRKENCFTLLFLLHLSCSGRLALLTCVNISLSNAALSNPCLLLFGYSSEEWPKSWIEGLKMEADWRIADSLFGDPARECIGGCGRVFSRVWLEETGVDKQGRLMHIILIDVVPLTSCVIF